MSELTLMAPESSAVIDPSGQFRYLLIRTWASGPLCCFIMFNPSTADATKNDPTIRRCIGFAKKWGFGSLEVVNLFAYRATDPMDIFKATDPVGPENDKYIRDAIARAGLIVGAWGAQDSQTVKRVWQVQDILKGTPIYCLGQTKCGNPRHPLYVAGKTECTIWRA